MSIDLDPGPYWLQVTPVGVGTGRAFNSTTVPEPGTLVLAGLALLAAGAARRRQA